MPTCTASSLVTGCFSGEVLNAKQRMAFLVYFMALELNAVGGTNYTSLLVSTASGGLLYDATQLAQKMTADQRQTAILNIYRNNAVAAGASPSADPSVLADNVKCLINATDDQLEQAFILLLCKLGKHTGT